MSQIKTKKVNDFKISKIKLPSISKKKIRGGDLLPLYSNTFLCAKKNSGKTTTIFNILKKCSDKETTLDLFVSTIEKDRSWIQIVKYFQNKGCVVNCHMSTIGDNGEDLIRGIIDTPIEFSDSESSASDSDSDYGYLEIGKSEHEEEKERKKLKKRSKKVKIAQKRIIVLDDIGNELKKPSIDQLLKVNRHQRCKTILSSQYLNDLSPMARRQIDVWLLFGGLKKNKLEQVVRDCDTRLTYNQFEEVYKFCTSKKYNFMSLYCDTDSYRKNFDKEIIIDETSAMV